MKNINGTIRPPEQYHQPVPSALNSSSTITNVLSHLALLAVGLLLSLLVAEGVVRLVDPSDNVRITASLDIFSPHPSRGFALRPGIVRATYWNGAKVHVKINDQGRRVPLDPDFVENRGKGQLIFCGDSFTFGNEENAAATFVYLLRDRVDRDTINLGVGGYSTYQALDTLREYYKSVDRAIIERVFLIFFVGNDFVDNTLPKERIRVNAQGRLQIARNPLAETLRGLIYPSRALSFIVLRCRTAYLNAKYWATGSPYPHIYSDAFYTEELIVATRQSLVEFKDYCTAHDLPLTVVVLPDKDQVYKTFADQADQRRPIQVLTNMLAELEIDYLDLLPVFLQWEDGPLYNMTPAGHLSAQGHRVAAQTIEKHFNML